MIPDDLPLLLRLAALALAVCAFAGAILTGQGRWYAATLGLLLIFFAPTVIGAFQ